MHRRLYHHCRSEVSRNGTGGRQWRCRRFRSPWAVAQAAVRPDGVVVTVPCLDQRRGSSRLSLTQRVQRSAVARASVRPQRLHAAVPEYATGLPDDLNPPLPFVHCDNPGSAGRLSAVDGRVRYVLSSGARDPRGEGGDSARKRSGGRNGHRWHSAGRRSVGTHGRTGWV